MPLTVFRKAGEDENIIPIESSDYYVSVLKRIHLRKFKLHER